LHQSAVSLLVFLCHIGRISTFCRIFRKHSQHPAHGLSRSGLAQPHPRSSIPRPVASASAFAPARRPGAPAQRPYPGYRCNVPVGAARFGAL